MNNSFEVSKKKKGKRSPLIAVLDPDPAILKYLHRILADRFRLSLFTEVAELTQSLETAPEPDLLLMDWHICEDCALDLLTQIHASKPTLPIVMLSASSDLREVVAATRMGARDVVLKPFRKADIDLVLRECLKETGTQEGKEDKETDEIYLDENTSFVRASKSMREIEAQCRLVARTDIPVLVLGESGTGKEVVTLFIHKMSARSRGGFMKVNCAAMPADLLESELFGYEQGAFTGAVKSKPGKFEICDNGTIFLDEIGEMPPVLQAKLLQVLQDGSFSRLGSRTNIKVNVRVIAATNIDIKAAIAQKLFREDLYYRLNGFTLKMPPLRERLEEIPILARHFMRKVSAKYERDPLPFSPALLSAFSGYLWPGNLRELENTVKRYFILGEEQTILDELIPRQSTESYVQDVKDHHGDGSLKHLVRDLKGNAESAAIERTLEKTGWNRKAAASNLQISYKALLYKIKQYKLIPPQKQSSPSQFSNSEA